MMKTAILLISAASLLQAWTYKGTVTFPAASGSSTLTDWTGVFTGSDTKLKTVGNGGFIQNTITRLGITIPADFIVTSDATCATVTGYHWGVSAYDGTAGTITVWVKMTLTTGSTVAPTVCIGNISVSTFQGGTQGSEYDSNVLRAYHFGTSSAQNLNDFSANAANLTATGSAAAVGEVDGGVSFNGTSDNLDGGTGSDLTGWTEFTVEWWFNGNAVGTNFPRMLSKGTINVSGFAMFWNGSVISWQVCPSGCTTVNTASVSGSVFHQIVGTYSTLSGIQHLYLDGTNTQNTNANAVSTTASDLFIGAQPASSSWYGGTMDEVIISKSERSLDWINNERSNQASPPVLGAFIPAPSASTQIGAFAVGP